MRIMLDTDVLISVIFYPSERTRRFIREISDRHGLLLCDCVVEELERVVARKFPVKQVAMEQFFLNLPYRYMATDPALSREERLLQAALHGQAELLISGDRALRSRVGEAVCVLSMSEFLGRVLMRKMLSWKMVLRARVKTLLTLLLIAASTFLFLYNLLEFTMTNRQYETARAQYWGNLTLDRPTLADGVSVPGQLDEWKGLVFLSSKENPVPSEEHPWERYHMEGFTAAQIEELLELPYADAVSTRYMTAGISDRYTRIDTHSRPAIMDFEFCQYQARMVLEATVVKKDYCENPIGSLGLSFASMGDDPTARLHNLVIDDIEVLAGDPQWLDQIECYNDYTDLPAGQHRILYDASFPEAIENREYMITSGGEGSPYFYQTNYMDEAFSQSLKVGQRYVFVCRVEPGADQASGRVPFGFLWFGDDTLYDWWPYAYDVTGLPGNYLEGEEFAPLRELIRITNDDLHTMDVVYAEDMRTLRRYQEGKFLLMEGRLLKEHDTLTRNPVCVISDVFAQHYGLQLGDRISLRLGDKLFENYAPLGAVASFRQRYAEHFTPAQEFEIVGLYHETGLEDLRAHLRYWAYSENAVFVPQSFLPVSEEALAEWTLSPADVSIMVSSADDIQAFADECLPLLDEMGYISYYSDNGWPEISRQLQQTGLLSLLKLAAFTVAVILVLLLTMYLFVIQRKKEFAIMRALGCPRRDAITVLLFPLSLLAVLGVALGSCAAVFHTAATIGDKLQSYASFGIPIDSSIPAVAVICSIAGCFGLLLLFAAAGLAYVARMHPLELLQGGSRAKKKKKAKQRPAEETLPAKFNLAAMELHGDFVRRTKPAPGFTRRYILRHSCRAAGKSLLIVLVTALLMGAMGQFAALRDSYRELYQKVDVKVRFLDFEHQKAKEFAETDYVGGGYFEIVFNAGELPHDDDAWERLDASYCLSNDLLYHVREEIRFLEGYDAETVMEVKDRVCIMPRYMMEWLGLELGDTVQLNERMTLEYIVAYNLNRLGEEKCVELYREHGVKATVVGCIETAKDTVYIPLASKSHYQNLFGTKYLTLAEYSLADYHKALELRSYAKSLLEPTYDHYPRFSMDTTEADRIYHTYRIIETLYPIAFAAAVIIGAVLMGLLVLQRAKEAATLRILGTGKGRTRLLLALEQVLLSLLGLLLAFLALFALNGAGLLKTAGAIGIYLAVHLAACLAGCIAAAVEVTRRRALELLQVKE